MSGLPQQPLFAQGQAERRHAGQDEARQANDVEERRHALEHAEMLPQKFGRSAAQPTTAVAFASACRGRRASPSNLPVLQALGAERIWVREGAPNFLRSSGRSHAEGQDGRAAFSIRCVGVSCEQQKSQSVRQRLLRVRGRNDRRHGLGAPCCAGKREIDDVVNTFALASPCTNVHGAGLDQRVGNLRDGDLIGGIGIPGHEASKVTAGKLRQGSQLFRTLHLKHEQCTALNDVLSDALQHRSEHLVGPRQGVHLRDVAGVTAHAQDFVVLSVRVGRRPEWQQPCGDARPPRSPSTSFE
jgi:hypothetical protein